ncbi:transposase [candidate division FCPU426 bacterium]|nr:transposase [candidate division FCPU426 bacterium]
MARQKRLNIPDAIYHVITRGLNGMNIFLDDKDRDEFITRLSGGLRDSQSQCYAWVLMSNHIHLLIRASENPLSYVLSRVLSGYAKAFNKKYKRRGYLFQNRFKSILCQEDRYFMELIRYIHLNPVRAGFIKTPEELKKYPYCGHGVIIGRNENQFQEVGEVLLQFAQTRKTAIREYKLFIEEGWEEGKREDLIGGGLVRSAGGWQGILELKKQKERWQGDDRILGDGEFVERILKQAEEVMRKQEKMQHAGWNLDKLADYVCGITGTSKYSLNQKARNNDLSKAKSLIAYWGYNELKIKGAHIANYLGIKNPSVNYLIKLGKRFAEEGEFILIF